MQLNTTYSLNSQIDDYNAKEYNEHKYIFEFREFVEDNTIVEYKSKNGTNIITQIYDAEDEYDCFDNLLKETFEDNQALERIFKNQFSTGCEEIADFEFIGPEFDSINIHDIGKRKKIYSVYEIVYRTKKAYTVKAYRKFLEKHSYFSRGYYIGDLLEQSYVYKCVE